jgi:hypothetical protein
MTTRRAKALARKRAVRSDGESSHWKNPRHENCVRNIDPIFNSLLGVRKDGKDGKDGKGFRALDAGASFSPYKKGKGGNAALPTNP